jgi:hypothetical protein
MKKPNRKKVTKKNNQKIIVNLFNQILPREIED